MTGARLRVVALALLAVAACTKANLERWPPNRGLTRDDKLEVQGRLCTRTPESLVFPLRVLFVVDCSESMKVTDPPDPVTGVTGRERAVRQVWQSLLAQGNQGVRVGIIRFSAQAQSRTPVDLSGNGVADTYFTADPNQLDAATTALGQTDRTTNYINALSESFFELRTEMLRADLASLPLSKYVVIFISDGLPDTDTTQGNDNTTTNILSAVKQLKDLAKLFHVGNFSFHTAFLSAGQNTAANQPAEDLLQQMAKVGGGTYRSFPSGESLNFLHVDLSVLRRIFTLKTLAVLNTNSVMDTSQIPTRPIPRIDDPGWVDLDQNHKMACGEPLVDSDGDGLADIVEERIGTDPFNKDTDDDGLSDRIEYDFRKSGLDPLDPKDSGCFVPDVCINRQPDGSCDCNLDTNHDGVCNCVNDPTHPCVDNAGHDCIDMNDDGYCDCPDRNHDGKCDYPDSDGDGLNDCEEILRGHQPQRRRLRRRRAPGPHGGALPHRPLQERRPRRPRLGQGPQRHRGPLGDRPPLRRLGLPLLRRLPLRHPEGRDGGRQHLLRLQRGQHHPGAHPEQRLQGLPGQRVEPDPDLRW